MDNKKFFRFLFGKCDDSMVTLMTLPGKQITHYKAEDLARVFEEAERMGATDGHILIQRFGDILNGKRTWQKELSRSNLCPTLPDAVDVTSRLPCHTVP